MLAQARNGIIIPPLTSFDGNVITPGTPFMARLAAHLRRFLAYKVGSDSDWRHIQVIPAHMHIPVSTVTVGTFRAKHGQAQSQATPTCPKGCKLLGLQGRLLAFATIVLSQLVSLSLRWVSKYAAYPPRVERYIWPLV